MSLMLRKAAQPILDSANLDPYHIEINESNKHMELKTPCGKPFATVHGVVFSRMHPTNAEIEFAIELLQEWVNRNQQDFDRYHDALETVQKLENKTAEKTIGAFKCEFKKDYDYINEKKVWQYFARLENENLICFLNSKNHISSIQVRGTYSVPVDVNKIFPSATEAKDALKFLFHHIKLQEAKGIVESIHEDLNSCAA